MLQTARWRPDTCDCIIDFAWDSEAGEPAVLGGNASLQEHVTITVTGDCNRHKALPDIDKYMQGARKDNQTKNRVFKALADSMLGDVHSPEAERELNDAYVWQFDADSVMEYKVLRELTTEHSNRLAQKLANERELGVIREI